MTDSDETCKEHRRSRGLRIPGFAQLQRLGKSLMLPIAVLPAAGILLRLGQPDLLGQHQGAGHRAVLPGDERGRRRASSPTCRCCSPSASPSDSPRRPTGRPHWPPSSATWWCRRCSRPCRRSCSRARSTRPASRPRSTTACSPASWSACSPRGCSTGTTPSNCRRTSASSAAGGSSRSWCRWRACSSAFAMSYFYPIFDAGPDRPRQVHRRLGRARRVRLRVRQPHADPARPAPHPELVHLVPLRRLPDPRTARSSPESSPGSPRATRRRAS